MAIYFKYKKIKKDYLTKKYLLNQIIKKILLIKKVL